MPGMKLRIDGFRVLFASTRGPQKRLKDSLRPFLNSLASALVVLHIAQNQWWIMKPFFPTKSVLHRLATFSALALVLLLRFDVLAQPIEKQQQLAPPLSAFLPDPETREKFRASAPPSAVESHTENDPIQGLDTSDRNAVNERLSQVKQRLGLREAEVEKQRPDLKVIAAYRAELEKYYQTNFHFIESLNRFTADSGNTAKGERAKLFRTLANLYVPQVILELSALDQFFVQLIRPGFEALNRADPMSWRTMAAELFGKQIPEGTIPKQNDRTLQRYREDVSSNIEAIKMKWEQAIKESTIPSEALTGIRVQTTYFLLSSFHQNYESLTTPTDLKELRQAVRTLTIVSSRLNQPGQPATK